MPVDNNKKGSPYFWYDFHFQGKRYRGSTKQTTRGAARQVETALLLKLSSGGSICQKSPDLCEFAPRFLEHVEKSRLDDDTKTYYKNGWRILKDQDIARMRIDGITTSSGSTIKANGGGSNINCALRTLRRMLCLAEEWGVLNKRPRIALVEEVERARVIRPNEEILFLAKANATMRDVFILMIDMGMRPVEVASLDWGGVDFVSGSTFIKKGKTPKSRRKLWMTDRVRTMLIARASNGSDWVFPSKRFKGQHIKAKSISVMGSKIKRDLGFPDDLVLYCARHTFATDYTEATGNLSKTQKALGHAAIKTTGRYVHDTNSKMGEVMDARNEERHNLSHSEYAVQ